MVINYYYSRTSFFLDNLKGFTINDEKKYTQQTKSINKVLKEKLL